MPCPFCGHSTSAVIRSRGGLVDDKIHRRRECASCGKRFPTVEQINLSMLERELQARGEALARALTDGELRPTWENAFMLLHRAWGDARDGRYPGVNQSLASLDSLLRHLQRVAS